MKLALLLSGAALATSAAALNISKPALYLNGTLQSLSADITLRVDVSTRGDGFAKVAATPVWASNVARGRKLMAAMKGTDAEAAKSWGMGKTAKSMFDGNLITELQQWGWNDQPPKEKANIDKQCDFDKYHKLARCFKDLGLGTPGDVHGGPNRCFNAEHWGGPFVKKVFGGIPAKENQRYIACGKTEMPVTGGYFVIGVNAAGGAIMALDRKSPAHAAAKLWKRGPKDFELPAIRSASDITWGFYNRATAGGNIKNIRYFFNCLIVNPEVQDLIRETHERLTPPRSSPGTWPGTEFSMDSEEGLALLGSPLGRSHGFFLIQHEEQLGGSKFISKVRVFKNDGMTFPYMVFYVDGPSGAGAKAGDSSQLETLMQTSNSTITRLRAKL